jgi:hypothetical protein
MPLCVNCTNQDLMTKTVQLHGFSPPSVASFTTINIIPSQPMLPLHLLYKHLFHLELVLKHF